MREAFTIPTVEMMNICLALPKCYLMPPNEAGCQYIMDQNDTEIGHIHWQFGEVAIYKEYEYCDEVIRAIESETGKKFNYIDHPDPDEYVKKEVAQMRRDGLMDADSLYGLPEDNGEN